MWLDIGRKGAKIDYVDKDLTGYDVLFNCKNIAKRERPFKNT